MSMGDAVGHGANQNRADAVTLTALGSAYRGRSADYPPGAPERAQYIQQAEATYKRALSANPSYGPAYYDLGLLYLDADPFPSGGGNLRVVAVEWHDEDDEIAGTLTVEVAGF